MAKRRKRIERLLTLLQIHVPPRKRLSVAFFAAHGNGFGRQANTSFLLAHPSCSLFSPNLTQLIPVNVVGKSGRRVDSGTFLFVGSLACMLALTDLKSLVKTRKCDAIVPVS